MRCIGLKFALAAGLALSSLAPAFAADSAAVPNAPARLEVTFDGDVFVTPEGKTLYFNGGDRNGRSSCGTNIVREMKDPTSGLGSYPIAGHQWLKSCVQKFPPYMAAADAKPVGDFTLITREEGKQWAWKGQPLYFSIKDRVAGDRNGVTTPVADARGRGGFRLASPPQYFPPGLKFAWDEEGIVIATNNGRPVYTPKGKISKQDEEAFAPLVAPRVGKVEGDWSIVELQAGRPQYAYRGKPLYAAADSRSDSDILDAGAWDLVVYRKGPSLPPEITKRFTLLGEIYTNKDGMTLYTFNCGGRQGAGGCDDPGDGAATMAALCGSGEECAKRWKPYLADATAKTTGEWSVIDVAYPAFADPAGQLAPPEMPRVKAWAWRGKPVYTYYEDKKPKDVFGNMIRWFAYSNFSAVRVPGRGLLD